MMLSGVPNFAFAIGYTNASWTLKCELAAKYVCRLLRHMDRNGYTVATPVLDDDSVEALPFMDFTSGYIQRAVHLLPKQGSERPWRLHQNYARDVVALRTGSVDEAMGFAGGGRGCPSYPEPGEAQGAAARAARAAPPRRRRRPTAPDARRRGPRGRRAGLRRDDGRRHHQPRRRVAQHVLRALHRQGALRPLGL